jgi:hypothetical protein
MIERLILAWGLLAATLGLAACGNPSVSVGCADIGFATVSDPSERVELRGFSVLPPTGPHWCLAARGETGVAYGKNAFGGRILQAVPSLEEQIHTFVAMAYVAEVDGPRPADAEALRAFVETWLRSGGLSQVQDPSGTTVMSDKPVAATRFTVVQASVAVDSSLGASCVRASSLVEERDNPRARGAVLILEEPDNYVCLHPTSPRELIVFGYSERYIKGRHPGPRFVETLKPEVEPFIGGIRFDAAG